MTQANSLFFPRSTFDAFLYAPIGEEKNGMELSVVSALARFGLDPWQEAARLAALPKQLAIDGLGVLLDRLPDGRWQRTDSATIAARLVQLLPQGRPAADADQPERGSRRTGSLFATIFVPILFALAAVIFSLATN